MHNKSCPELSNQIKVEMGVTESVKAVRDGLDKVVEDVVETFLNPGRWNGPQALR